MGHPYGVAWHRSKTGSANYVVVVLQVAQQMRLIIPVPAAAPLSAEYIVMTLHDELTVPEGTPLHRTVLKCVFIYLIYGMKVQGISPLDAHARAAGYYPQDRHGYGVGSEGRAFTVLRRQGEAAKRGGGQRESGGGAPGSGRGQRQQGGRRRGRRQQRKGGRRRGSVAEARG